MGETNVYSSYTSMEGHEGYYQNSKSLKIRYIKVHNGTTVRIATKKTKITEAKKVVEEHLISLFSANPAKEKLTQKGVKSPLIPLVWEQLMEARGITNHENTMTGYDISWRIGIEPFWGKKTVASLGDFSQITIYTKWYLKTHPTRVFFNTGKHLSMLIRYAKQNGFIDKQTEVPDLDVVIAARSQKKDVGRVYTQEEYQACIDNAFSPMVETGIITYRHMGVRKNELLKARRENWDLKNKIALVWSDKNKKWREIVIPDVVVVALKKWLSTCAESVYLFPAPTNPKKFVASQVYDEQWRKTKVAADIKDAEVENAARTHDWRHTFATQTATDGWPPIVACYVLDMSLQEYQDTYTHVTIADIMKLMTKSFGSQKAAK